MQEAVGALSSAKRRNVSTEAQRKVAAARLKMLKQEKEEIGSQVGASFSVFLHLFHYHFGPAPFLPESPAT